MSFGSVLADLVSTDENVKVPDEGFLNLLRTNDRIAMGTQEIADVTDMSRQGAENRLNQLEDDGRVRSEKIGDNLVWDLHPDERTEPVPPEIDRLVRGFDRVRNLFEPSRRLGLYILFAGFAAVFTAVSSSMTSTPIDSITTPILAVGWMTAALGGAVWFIAGSTQFITLVIERVAYWRLTGRSLRSWTPSQATPTDRGQVDPRLVVGGLVILLIAGPLLTAAGELQSGLANSPGFSPFWAAVIALLFVAAIVAGILGIE